MLYRETHILLDELDTPRLTAAEDLLEVIIDNQARQVLGNRLLDLRKLCGLKSEP